MNRRSFLLGGVTVAAGAGAWQYRDNIGGGLGSVIGPPKTETPINTLSGRGVIQTMTLYESGAAKFVLADDYGCRERIAVGDSPPVRSDYLADWQLPSDGELVVDMGGAVSSTNDPSNQFYVKAVAGRGEMCISASRGGLSFRAIDSWER